jgi:ketosteroid isomerase-like protein
VRQVGRRGALGVLGVLACLATGGSASATRGDTKSVEDAVLAVSAEMTKAGEAVDADRLFSYMLDTDKGSVVQNGIVMATRQEALERVRSNLRGINRIEYRWKRQYVSVLSPEVAVLTSDGESTATTAAGDTFITPFAQTVVFVRRAGGWKAIHAHQSSPRRP